MMGRQAARLMFWDIGLSPLLFVKLAWIQKMREVFMNKNSPLGIYSTVPLFTNLVWLLCASADEREGVSILLFSGVEGGSELTKM